MDNTGNEGRKLNPYYVQDLRLGYSFPKLRPVQADLILQVNNVFNKMYEPNGYTFSYYANHQLATENYYYPMAGINWMLGLNIKIR
jgi:iron complex outermembrane receptor protein